MNDNIFGMYKLLNCGRTVCFVNGTFKDTFGFAASQPKAHIGCYYYFAIFTMFYLPPPINPLPSGSGHDKFAVIKQQNSRQSTCIIPRSTESYILIATMFRMRARQYFAAHLFLILHRFANVWCIITTRPSPETVRTPGVFVWFNFARTTPTRAAR